MRVCISQKGLDFIKQQQLEQAKQKLRIAKTKKTLNSISSLSKMAIRARRTSPRTQSNKTYFSPALLKKKSMELNSRLKTVSPAVNSRKDTRPRRRGGHYDFPELKNSKFLEYKLKRQLKNEKESDFGFIGSHKGSKSVDFYKLFKATVEDFHPKEHYLQKKLEKVVEKVKKRRGMFRVQERLKRISNSKNHPASTPVADNMRSFDQSKFLTSLRNQKPKKLKKMSTNEQIWDAEFNSDANGVSGDPEGAQPAPKPKPMLAQFNKFFNRFGKVKTIDADILKLKKKKKRALNQSMTDLNSQIRKIAKMRKLSSDHNKSELLYKRRIDIIKHTADLRLNPRVDQRQEFLKIEKSIGELRSMFNSKLDQMQDKKKTIVQDILIPRKLTEGLKKDLRINRPLRWERDLDLVSMDDKDAQGLLEYDYQKLSSHIGKYGQKLVRGRKELKSSKSIQNVSRESSSNLMDKKSPKKYNYRSSFRNL